VWYCKRRIERLSERCAPLESCLTRAPGRRDQFNGPKLGHDCNRVATYVTASTAAAAASTTCSNISGAHVSLARRAIGGAMAFFFYLFFTQPALPVQSAAPSRYWTRTAVKFV